MPRALFLGLLLMPFAARAQFVDVQPGVRVRVTAPGVVAGRIEGTVVARTADSVVVATPQSAQFRIGIVSITELTVSRGKSRVAGAKRGAVWAAGITGPLLILGVATDPTFESSGEKAGFVAFGTALYAGIGALIGAAIGAEAWSPHVMTPAVSIAGTREGVRVGARMAF